MEYNIRETREAIQDVTDLAVYMIEEFSNHKAALDFINKYDAEVSSLRFFPFGYRGISIEYRGYEIRLKPFGTYNIFFIVDTKENIIVILKVLKDRQDWKSIIHSGNEYHDQQ